MARPLRIEYAGAFYHVLNRGQRQEPIVQNGQECERYAEYLAEPAGNPFADVAPEAILTPGGKRNCCRDVAICLAREFSGLCGWDLGHYFGGIGGPAVAMRCREILRHAVQDR